VTTGGEEMDVAQISPEPTGSEEPCSDWFKRELKVPRVRSVKFCSIMAVEEADLVVALSRMKSGGSRLVLLSGCQVHVNVTSLGEVK